MSNYLMEIQTERLVLRPLGLSYLNSTNEYSTDIENTKFMVYLPNDGLEETREFLVAVEEEWKKDKPEFWEFAVLLDGVHIGAVSLYFNEPNTCGELGWIISKEYWGRGYAYEASKAMVEACIEKMNIRKFIAHCDSENLPSAGVMRKLGMQLVDQYGGRKNRSSDEVREECKFELIIADNREHLSSALT